MNVLFLSPHLDDAVFSCGALINQMSRDCVVTVATVFSASVPHASGFALECQTDKGIPAHVDYMALRRCEDASACARLGANPVWLGLREAPHRGYHNADALFEARHDDDELQPVIDAIAPLARTATLIAAPLGLGGHVDHHMVADALRALRPGVPVWWWEDMPYAVRLGSRDPGLTSHLPTREDLAAKLHACAAYRSQLGFQFGGESRMRSVLQADAIRYGERFAMPTCVAA